MTGTRIEGQTAAVLCRVAVPIAVAVTVFAGAAQARADSSPVGTDGTTTEPSATSTVGPAPDPTRTTTGGGSWATTGPAPAIAPPTGPHTFTSKVDTRGPAATGGSSGASTSTATATTSNSTATSAPAPGEPCPLPPPQQHDNGDRGFFTIKVASQPSNQFLVTLTFRCYDKDEPQNATVKFTGVAPTGEGQSVSVLAGHTKFTFDGHKSTSIVDAQQTYLLDPTVLGPAASDGWHAKVNVGIVPDNSASRAALIVLGTGPGPKPSVLPFHAQIPHSTLPQTGSDVIKIYGVGIVATSIGLYLWYVGALPVRRPKHRA